MYDLKRFFEELSELLKKMIEDEKLNRP